MTTKVKDNKPVKVNFRLPQYWINCDPESVLKPPRKKASLRDRNAQDSDCSCGRHSKEKTPASKPILDNTMPKSARKQFVCGRDSIKLECQGCGKPHYLDYFCGSRICPVCAKRRQNEILHKMQDFVRKFRLPYGMEYRFITLTILRSSFERDVNIAMKALQKLWHNLLEPNGVGAITHLELAPGGMVHWHMIYIGRFIPKSKLNQAWFKATGNSYVTDIKLIPHKHLDNALLELSKYITKFSETPGDMLFAFYMQVKNRRLLRTFGVLFDYKWDENRKCLLMCECGSQDFRYIKVVDSLVVPVPFRETG